MDSTDNVLILRNQEGYLVVCNSAMNKLFVVKVSLKRDFEFQIKCHKTKAIFEIEGSGEAVAPKVLPNIFEPFFTTKPL